MINSASLKSNILKAAVFLSAILALFVFTGTVKADEIHINVESSDGYPTDVLTDDDYMTTDYYMAGTTLTITSDEQISSLYIKWESLPGKYTITADGKDYEFGDNEYLHEYVKLPAASSQVVLTIPQDRVSIADIYAFSEGSIPDWVQTWEDSYEEADILIFSAHSDDEILFMGSIVPTYIDKGARVQIAYYCDLSLTEPYRRHELLDGIWTMGVTHYPQLGEFEDLYSEDLETARLTEPDLDASMEYVVRTIRRFKPLVLVSHDVEGEYGHGQHRLLADLITQAIDITNDSAQYPESAGKYGTWDVPKTYLHLYGDNLLTIDDSVPLSHFGGRTAFEICKDAYAKHESQSWMWFFVGNEYSVYENPESSKYGQTYEYPFNKFGLYRTLVGADTGNDILENVTTYDEQIRIAEEEASIAARESAEAEEASRAQAEAESIAAAEAAAKSAARRTTWFIVIIVIVVIILAAVIILVLNARKKEKERRRRAAAARKRRMQNGGRNPQR